MSRRRGRRSKRRSTWQQKTSKWNAISKWRVK